MWGNGKWVFEMGRGLTLIYAENAENLFSAFVSAVVEFHTESKQWKLEPLQRDRLPSHPKFASNWELRMGPTFKLM
jgi:hypothetical protein